MLKTSHKLPQHILTISKLHSSSKSLPPPISSKGPFSDTGITPVAGASQNRTTLLSTCSLPLPQSSPPYQGKDLLNKKTYKHIHTSQHLGDTEHCSFAQNMLLLIFPSMNESNKPHHDRYSYGLNITGYIYISMICSSSSLLHTFHLQAKKKLWYLGLLGGHLCLSSSIPNKGHEIHTSNSGLSPLW